MNEIIKVGLYVLNQLHITFYMVYQPQLLYFCEIILRRPCARIDAAFVYLGSAEGMLMISI